MSDARFHFRSVLAKIASAPLLLLLLCAATQGQPANSPGLICTANDDTRKVVFIVPTPNFHLKGKQSIHPQLGERFEAKWDGFLRINRAGRYTFDAGSARVLIHGSEVTNQTPVQLDAGDLPLHIEFHRGEHDRLQLTWQSDLFKREPIPWTAFSHSATPPELSQSEKLARGRELAEEFNCTACHKTDKTFFQSRPGPNLSSIGSRVNANWIFKWLENPRHFRAAAMMPALLESDQERADVTTFLASLSEKNSRTEIAADSARMGEGKKLFEDTGCVACHGDDTVSLAGLGSKMTAGQIADYLKAPLAIDPSGRMPDMLLTNGQATLLACYLAESKNAEFEPAPSNGNSERGKDLVQSRGCLNCHTLTIAGQKIESTLITVEFAKLTARAGGCLAEHPSNRVPRYGFTTEERAALAAFVGSPDVAEAPVQDFHRLTRKYNCASCHELYGPAKLAFAPNQSPPPLTDGGNKLRRSWLEKVFVQKKRVRSWLPLHMPDFGAENVNSLLDGFAAQAGTEFGEGEKLHDLDVAVIEDGIHFIGRDNGGLSCISCHDYRGQKSEGEMRGPDLIEMYDRCRTDWMTRWLRDPGRIIPGTAMPEYFSGLPDNVTEGRIQHIMQALGAGEKMPVPAGLTEDSRDYVLLATNEPVVQRCFLPDASPRAIAVGFPGQINCCFDAATCRLCYAWNGNFLDMKPAWSWRGGKPPQTVGPKFYTAPQCFPLRIGDRAREPKVKFLGYDLIKKTPEFRYEVDGVLVRERISASEQNKALVLSFTLGKLKDDVWFNGGPDAIVTAQPAAISSQDWWKISSGKAVQFQVTLPAKSSAQLQTSK